MNLPILSSFDNFDGLTEYYAFVNSQPFLSPDEERELGKELKLNNNSKAAEQLILSNLRVSVSQSKKLAGYQIPIADLIQQGNIGLVKAAQHFDYTQGVLFYTYALHWVKSEMYSYILSNWKILKVATSKPERKLFFNLRSLVDIKTVTKQDIKMVSAELNIPQSIVTEMVQRMTFNTISLTSTDEERDYSNLEYELIDPSADVLDSYIAINQSDILQQAILQLPERDQYIIKHRFFVDPVLSLEQLSLQLNISIERVRQLQQRALKTLKSLLSQYH